MVRFPRMSVVLLIAGCESSTASLPEPTWHGRWVSIGTTDERPPCAGTTEYMDGFVEAAHVVLGETIASDFHVDYLWLPRAMDRAPCDPDDNACTLATTIYAPVLADEHELVHAVVFATWGRTVDLFEEGIAEAIGSGKSVSYDVQSGGFDPKALLAERRLDVVFYEAAGAFVRTLADRHGFAKLGEFFRSTSRDAAVGVVLDRFEEVFGESFDDFVDVFFEQERQCLYDWPRCFGPEVPWQGDDRWSWSSQMMCDHAHVQGPMGSYADPVGVYGERRVRARVIVDVVADGDYEISVAGPPPEMQRCGPCDGRSKVVLPASGISRIPLAEGRYSIESMQAIAAAEPFEIVLERP